MMDALAEERRRQAMSVWAGLLSFGALFFFTAPFVKSAVVGIFVSVSCLLGFGSRWLTRGSLVIGAIAFALWLGVPGADQWAQLLDETRRTLAAARW